MNQNRELAEDLAKSLQVTTTLMQNLLGEIRDNAASLAMLKQKLEGIEEKVQSLSQIVRNGNGQKSLITRVALIEKEIEDFEKELDLHIKHDEDIEKTLHARVSSVKSLLDNDKKTAEEFKREKTIGMIKLAATIIPGLAALGIVIVKYFIGAD